MNIKTNLLEDYVDFVDNTRENTYFEIFLILFTIYVSLLF